MPCADYLRTAWLWEVSHQLRTAAVGRSAPHSAPMQWLPQSEALPGLVMGCY